MGIAPPAIVMDMGFDERRRKDVLVYQMDGDESDDEKEDIRGG